MNRLKVDRSSHSGCDTTRPMQAACLSRQRGEGKGHRDKAAGGWGRRAGVLGGPGMCAGGVTKSSTSTTSHQVQDQTSHHTSNTLLLVSPSFLLSWYKKGECSTLFYQIWFSLHRPIIIPSGIRLPFSDFSKIADLLRKIWFQTNHISSGQILRHRLMTTFHTDPILWHQYSSSGKYVPLFRQN